MEFAVSTKYVSIIILILSNKVTKKMLFFFLEPNCEQSAKEIGRNMKGFGFAGEALSSDHNSQNLNIFIGTAASVY